MTRDRELGDFQTPPALVAEILKCLMRTSKRWTRVLEPTCGEGNFIRELLDMARPPSEIQGLEIQEDHVREAMSLASRARTTTVVIRRANIFDFDLQRGLAWQGAGPLLVVGNPPWVTNSELGSLRSSNLPKKTNVRGLKGIDALTGESNFDIAEFIWLKLLTELADEKPTIALLCKTSVARNVLRFAADARLPVSSAAIYKVDAKKWFDASVDACLFAVELDSAPSEYKALVYESLDSAEPISVIGVVEGRLVADMEKYRLVSFADGECPVTWRQGLKHDAAQVMELIRSGDRFWNRLGEQVEVEPEFLYPLVKGSDLHRGTRPHESGKVVIVTQRRLGEDTKQLEHVAPRLWSYLTSHVEFFQRRRSSIYQGRPAFALFGIGDYTFAPYKVAVSGFHKRPVFRALPPVQGRPAMLDDTCYFVPCDDPRSAALLVSLLNDESCQQFLDSLTFGGSKRPITQKLLNRVDLGALLRRVNRSALLSRADAELQALGAPGAGSWPRSLHELVTMDDQPASQLQLL